MLVVVIITLLIMAKTKTTTASARKKKAEERKKAAGKDKEKTGSNNNNNKSNKRGAAAAAAAALPAQKNKKAREMGSTAPPETEEIKDEKAAAGKGKGKGERAQNFLTVEDVCLCKAYVSCTEDPIKGSDQDVEVFWAKVHEKWNELMRQDEHHGDCFTPRTWKSLKDRFQRQMSKNVSNFNRHYKEEKATHRTGWTEADYIKKATQNYEAMEGKPFKFTDCVEILHALPKFSPDNEPEDSNPDVNNIGGAMGADKPRPAGQKQAKKLEKENKKKDAGTVASMESAKVEQLTNLAAASSRMAEVMNRKQRNDTTMSMAKMCMQMGDIAMAKKLMDGMQKQMEEDKAEDKANNAAPVGEVNNTNSGPMSEVTVTNATGSNDENDSGHVASAREKAITQQGDKEELQERLQENEQQEEAKQEGSTEEEGSEDSAVARAATTYALQTANTKTMQDEEDSNESVDTANEVLKMATQNEQV